jgi:uncharacterized membrane protein YjjP (DUF1212 family)
MYAQLTTIQPDTQHLLRQVALELATALRSHGAPAHRVEDRMAEFAWATGLEVQLHVLPGCILVSTEARTEVLTVSAGLPNLDRLCGLEDLAEDTASGKRSPAQALRALAQFRARPDRYDLGTTLVAFAVASATAVSLFGGGPVDIGAAALVGLISGVLATQLGNIPHATHLIEVAAGMAGALALTGLGQLLPINVEVALVTGLIVLLPGFSLTTALTELATGHRVSGTAGLAAGALVLLELGFGAALGSRLAETLWGPPTWTATSGPLPWWWEPVAIVGVGLGFAVLLQARPRHVWQVVGACALALYGQRAGVWLLGPELAGGLAALAVAVVSNALSRRLRQPAAVWQWPGILLLVPGSIGFSSISALLDHDVLSGVEAAFGTALACMALVGGSLLGSALVPPRSSL